jgi:hypothetical protein
MDRSAWSMYTARVNLQLTVSPRSLEPEPDRVSSFFATVKKWYNSMQHSFLVSCIDPIVLKIYPISETDTFHFMVKQTTSTNNFLSVYQQAGLNEDIKTRLPHTLNGHPIALLLAVCLRFTLRDTLNER